MTVLFFSYFSQLGIILTITPPVNKNIKILLLTFIHIIIHVKVRGIFNYDPE